MAVNPRDLKPAEVVRLLNSTPVGETLTDRKFHRHRLRAGYRIGSGSKIDLYRYAAWLVGDRHLPKPPPSAAARGPDGYDAVKEAARQRSAELSKSGRDIGDLPAVVDPERKRRTLAEFRFFCESYFPHVFPLKWSDDHLKVIAKVEQAVLHGGLFALAMPRGSGKTSICECACLWAVFNGAREFVALIGASEAHAEEMLDSIKMELEVNDLLLEDFPEVVYPIHCLDGIANRCNGQLYQGKRTYISWTAKVIVLPMIEGSAASGAIIKVAGITGRVRGMKYKRADGKPMRPSLVILDDPQTDESAGSLTQSDTRERVLSGAVLGLAGPKRKIAGVMPCTVIRRGDMADNILDRQKHPDWQGERTQMVYAWPTNAALWEEYARLRSQGLQEGRQLEYATAFYAANRAAMDEGSVVAWPERFNLDELSAIQNAVNLRLRDERAFLAEYQNEPPDDTDHDADELTADQIAAKINGLPRKAVPIGCTRVTAFIDVHKELLYWMVCGWADDFTGVVIDYGAFPDQHKSYFALRDAAPTLADVAGGRTGMEGAIYAGLEATTALLLGAEWRRDDGAAMRVERCLIDAQWGEMTDVVYQFCRQSAHAAVLHPSHGKGVDAAGVPFSDYKRRPGDRVGHYWRIPNVMGKRALRHVLFDSNYWKSFVFGRLDVPLGDHGCLSFFGHEPYAHKLLADHLKAEAKMRTESETKGRVVYAWRQRGNRPDNHWLDCLTGCAVGASIQGASLPESSPTKAQGPSRAKLKLSELQKRRNGEA